jgi:Helix-turn-helix domain
MSDLGDLLRATRESMGLSVAEAAIETRIRSKIIIALEAGDLSQLPPEPFIRGLLRNYARLLHVEPDLVLEIYAIEAGLKSAPGGAPQTPEGDLHSGPTIPQERRAAPDRPPTFVLHSPTPQSRPTDLSDSTPNQSELPPFLSPTHDIPTKLQGGFSSSSTPERTLPTQPPGQPRETKQDANIQIEQIHSVFQFAPEVPPEPLPAPNRASGIRGLSATKIPEAVAAIAVAVAFLAVVAFGYSRLHGAASSPPPIAFRVATARPTPSPQRVTTALPTPVPTFEAAPVAGTLPSPTATKTVATVPNSLLANVPPDAEMDVQISAGESPVWVWIVADNVERFKGNLLNETRDWTAHEVLYIQVKDLPNGTVSFNGKPILARVFEERKVLERSWEMTSSGTPAAAQPVPFVPSSTPIPSLTLSPSPTFRPSRTPTSTSTSVPTNTPSPSPTLPPSPTSTATSLPTDTPSPSPTLAPSPTASATASSTPTECPEVPGIPC